MQSDINIKKQQYKLKNLSNVGKLHGSRKYQLNNLSKEIGTIYLNGSDNCHSQGINGLWPVTHRKNVTFQVYNYSSQKQPQSTEVSFYKELNNKTTKIFGEEQIQKNVQKSKVNSPITKSDFVGRIFKQKNYRNPQQEIFSLPKYLTTQNLPFINKVQTNNKHHFPNDNSLKVVKKSRLSNHPNSSLERNLKQSYKKIGCLKIVDSTIIDPSQEQSLKKHKKRRNFWPVINSQISNFSQKVYRSKKSSPEIQSSHIKLSKSKSRQKSLKKLIDQYEQYQDDSYSLHEDNNSRNPGFIYHRIAENLGNSAIISLDTPLSTIKQLLVQCNKSFDVSFRIPELFFQPIFPTVSNQQLHKIMAQGFSFINVRPQIVSFIRYENCVMMKQKDICMLWYYNGKRYFGGWKENEAQGCKEGLGLQWGPSSKICGYIGYIYYGQFKKNTKHGYGIMKKSSKQFYIGQWQNNKRWGWGKQYNSDGVLTSNGQYISDKCIKKVIDQ